jgi:asparagine synthase (glutamine-hydrolysing)
MEAFREVFDLAVQSRLRSVHPVASLLSGGLDSSAIVATAGASLAARGHKLHTLSSVPVPGAQDRVAHEREFIDVFRGQPQLAMHSVSAPERGPFDRLEELVETASLCSYSYQHYLYTALVDAARESGARIILDGDGGELSASTTPQGYLAELLITGRWPLLARELRALNGPVWPLIKRAVLRPLIPPPLLKALKRSAAPTNPLPYPLRFSFVADVLDREAGSVEAEVLALFAERPDHRRNQARQIELRRADLRQRSHAGFIGYHEVRFGYPFMDRRVLEFCLAADGWFKQCDGQSRRLLRLGMHGRLSETILTRRSKAPIAPDYHLRYLRARATARKLLQAFSVDSKLADIIDFERVAEALEQDPVYRADRPMRVDYRSQFLVPNALYLCYFLKRHGS